MHLQHAAKNKADAPADAGQHSARLQEMCAAAEAVTQVELLHLGLPVLRSVNFFPLVLRTCCCPHLKCAQMVRSCVYRFQLDLCWHSFSLSSDCIRRQTPQRVVPQPCYGHCIGFVDTASLMHCELVRLACMPPVGSGSERCCLWVC